MRTIRVVLCGAGGVARNMVRASRERTGLEIVAAWSRDAALQGRDLGELAGGAPTGVRVTGKPEALATPADVLLIATTSFLREVEAEIHDGIAAGLDVVCTAEEMAFPWAVDGAIARAIDEHALQAGVTVVGAGANPGYIYEVVGLALTGAVWRIDEIAVQRIVDLSGYQRRRPAPPRHRVRSRDLRAPGP